MIRRFHVITLTALVAVLLGFTLALAQGPGFGGPLGRGAGPGDFGAAPLLRGLNLTDAQQQQVRQLAEPDARAGPSGVRTSPQGRRGSSRCDGGRAARRRAHPNGDAAARAGANRARNPAGAFPERRVCAIDSRAAGAGAEAAGRTRGAAQTAPGSVAAAAPAAADRKLEQERCEGARVRQFRHRRTFAPRTIGRTVAPSHRRNLAPAR